MIKVGIDDIQFYTSSFYLDLKDLAEVRGIDPNKFNIGIGQSKMAVPSPDEDIVTMGANAALPLVERCDKEKIGTILLATETGIDQSKTASIFINELLDLPKNIRTVELKQACYSGTAAVQMACALVSRNPEKTVLVIASDIAKYDLDSPGEATQGCGAVAMLIKANPSILEIAPESGCFSENVHDFWRPNYRNTPVVDGKFSTMMYIKAAKNAWEELAESAKISFDEIDHFCYHLPFTTMGEKAHLKLAKSEKSTKTREQLQEQLAPSLTYNSEIGNSYTASVYISLCALLDNIDLDLTDKKVAIFSFGSGCASEFFYGKVVAGYKAKIHSQAHKETLDSRTAVSFKEYLNFYNFSLPTNGEEVHLEHETRGKFRLSAVKNHYRLYEKCER